ncbi:amidohydrolase family protein [Kutzneria kofuensis]|uniref:Imidazolonepropionase-like amidohydrolase n=1 Tax=Kutzneria kofuensis TaxID=103725 RepID=A0A7W9NGA5_9PSEU|nr:amidohydrolase family protein [Kutzneria kofuensis]MBB5891294.1 imidazolonepropionase-like amidohydrolase [Kutzneria kofuensis]
MIGLRCARLFDGDTMHHGRRTVVLDGGRIVGVGATDAPVVDLGDVTLMPGLVDAHTHLAFAPGSDIVGDMTSLPREVVLERMREHAGQALRAGITTVRDLGDRDYLAVELRDGSSALPEILAAGPPITTPGGHCWFLGGEVPADRSALADAVAERVARGVDVIKVMATGGSITPGSAAHESQYDFSQLSAIVEAAHSAGLPVTAHAHGGSGIRDAVRAGVDGIEHGTFLTADGAEPDWSTIRELIAARVYVGVTAGRLLTDAPPPPRVLAARAFLPEMQRSGALLVCSSDAGIISYKPHYCLPFGLTDFQQFTELSPAAVLTSVTRLAADSCSVGSRKGRIAPGYDADLLAVHGDPSQDLAVLRDVAAVYRAGVPVELG